MAREATPYTETNPMALEIDLTVPHAITKQEVDDLQAAQMAMERRAQSLATQLRYDGELTIGAIDDKIRWNKRRSTEAVLELGKCMLLLKELTSHGEFTKRIEMHGFSDRMARKFMSATLKFCKTASKAVLEAAGNQTKLFELLVLDDEEITDLSAGGVVCGLDLDDIGSMSTTELRAALRRARAEASEAEQIKQAQLQAKDKLINGYEERLHRQQAKPPEIRGEEAIKTLEKNARLLASRNTAELCRDLRAVYDAMEDGFPTETAKNAMLGAFHTVIAGVRDAAIEHGLIGHLDGLFPPDPQSSRD